MSKKTVSQRVSAAKDVVARRVLRAPGRKTVEILVHNPQLVTNDPEEWSCAVSVHGCDSIVDPIRGHGVDSLQALFNALRAARNTLRHQRTLTWLGSPQEIGFPLMVSEEDPDFVSLIEGLISIEFSRMVLLKKTRPGQAKSTNNRRRRVTSEAK